MNDRGKFLDFNLLFLWHCCSILLTVKLLFCANPSFITDNQLIFFQQVCFIFRQDCNWTLLLGFSVFFISWNLLCKYNLFINEFFCWCFIQNRLSLLVNKLQILVLIVIWMLLGFTIFFCRFCNLLVTSQPIFFKFSQSWQSIFLWTLTSCLSSILYSLFYYQFRKCFVPSLNNSG